MFEIVPFSREHILPLLEQKMNSSFKDTFSEEGCKNIVSSGQAFTGMINDKVVVCGGSTPIWSNRSIVWTVFDEDSADQFLSVFRGIKKWCHDQPVKRLEMSVPAGDEKYMRRAVLFGFKLEAALMKSYLPCGGDCSLYSLVKGEKDVNV